MMVFIVSHRRWVTRLSVRKRITTWTFCDNLKLCSCIVLIKGGSRTVPHSQSGAVPMSSLLGVGQLGFWEVGKGGTIG
jgi:hypothetical protein